MEVELEAQAPDEEASGEPIVASCITCGEDFDDGEARNNCFACGALFHVSKSGSNDLCFMEDAEAAYCSEDCMPKVRIEETQDE
jgi:hypothetical protein